MIIDLRIYSYAPSRFQSFLAMYRDTGFALTSRHLGTTIAIMTSHSGKANQTLQMFAYRDARHRDECRLALRSDPEWLAFIREAGQCIVEQHNTILRPTAFSPLSRYDQLAGGNGPASTAAQPKLFECQTLTAQPGRLADALGLLGGEIEPLAAAHADRPVGSFIGHTGVANRIYRLLGYSDDASRDACEARMSDDPGLAALHQRFDPMFAEQQRDLWLATAYSPLR